MDINKSYVLGLLVGAGTITSHGFEIKLPFKNWGVSPSTGSLLVTDVVNKVIKVFEDAYNCHIGFKVDNSSNWILEPTGNFDITTIKSELTALALPSEGVILNKADISYLKNVLTPLCAEYFLAGIFDAKASLADSHRRFHDGAPIVSIEIPGSTQNFKFVVQLCSWLTDLGGTTDQILYNHPSQQAGINPTYKEWKKGFKIRFLAASFLAQHSFLLGAKINSLKKLVARQEVDQQIPCAARIVSPKPKSIHVDLGSRELPDEVRNKIFLHYLHYCAVLGCKHAPVRSVLSAIGNYDSFISAFPLLVKGSYDEMFSFINNIRTEYFPDISEITFERISVREVVNNYGENYPKTESAIAYLVSNTLMGKRPLGSSRQEILSNLDFELDILSIDDEICAPVFFGCADKMRGVVLSSLDGDSNSIALEKMIEIDGVNINVKENNERN
jgi:hypothetical protein